MFGASPCSGSGPTRRSPMIGGLPRRVWRASETRMSILRVKSARSDGISRRKKRCRLVLCGFRRQRRLLRSPHGERERLQPRNGAPSPGGHRSLPCRRGARFWRDGVRRSGCRFAGAGAGQSTDAAETRRDFSLRTARRFLVAGQRRVGCSRLRDVESRVGSRLGRPHPSARLGPASSRPLDRSGRSRSNACSLDGSARDTFVGGGRRCAQALSKRAQR